MHHLGICPAEEFDQAIDRVGMLTAHIETLTDHIRLRRRDERINDIRHIGEVPRLLPRADNRIWFSRQLLTKEHAEYRAIRSRSARTRPIDVEQAKRDYRQLIDLRPVEGNLFAQSFCQRIGILRADVRLLIGRKMIRNPIA